MPNIRGRTRTFSLAMLLGLALAVPALSLAAPDAAATVRGDLGDAPDSTNNFGLAMPAYPWGVVANFPTVFNVAPQGPLHWAPGASAWLGVPVPSMENDADLLPDADGLTNIDPTVPVDDRDRFDDGVMPVNPGPPAGINLPQCGGTGFRYIVTGAAAPLFPNAVVNVWFDFNRDGDWNDTLTCTTPSGGVLIVPEWAVQNQVVPVPAGGSVVFATPGFASFHTLPYRDIWMRINIAEQKAPPDPATGVPDGRGPAAGYRTGETEDYHLRFTGTPDIYG